jgi:hypothetical protein
MGTGGHVRWESMITLDFKKQSAPPRTFLLSFLKNFFFGYKKAISRKFYHNHDSTSPGNIINIQIPILEIPFQGDAS